MRQSTALAWPESVSHNGRMREFKVLLRRPCSNSVALEYHVMTRHACRAVQLATRLLERYECAAADIFEGGLLLRTVTPNA
jgi:hypothetical protein